MTGGENFDNRSEAKGDSSKENDAEQFSRCQEHGD